MKKYLLIFGGFCACLFVSGEIYSFVYDVEPNHMAEILGQIEIDRKERESSQDFHESLEEVLDRTSSKNVEYIDRFLDEISDSFNVFGIGDTYERQ